jgi:hypothetical protein
MGGNQKLAGNAGTSFVESEDRERTEQSRQ